MLLAIKATQLIFWNIHFPSTLNNDKTWKADENQRNMSIFFFFVSSNRNRNIGYLCKVQLNADVVFSLADVRCLKPEPAVDTEDDG